MMDRILLNKQEERFFFEFLRIAGNRTPAECAQEIAASLETRSQGEILQFYGQTVDTIFKGQKGALDGFTYQKTHRILTKFYDTKVLPLYAGSGGSLEAGGSERKGASRKRKCAGSVQDVNDGEDRNGNVGDRRNSVQKEMVEEVELFSGERRVAGAEGVGGAERAAGNFENASGVPHGALKDASENHGTPQQPIVEGLRTTPCTNGGSVHTVHTHSQGAGAGRGTLKLVEIMFVPHAEELATRLSAGGFDPCPRLRLDASETVVNVMRRLERSWETVFQGQDGGLRLRPPDDCPAVFRGCAWGDPERDVDLRLMEVLEALGVNSLTTMGYDWDDGLVRSHQKVDQLLIDVPTATVTGRLTAKKGKRPVRKAGENKRNAKSASERKGMKEQVAGNAPGKAGNSSEKLQQSDCQGPGSSTDKENTANKSFSFEHQAIASFGSPAQDSAQVKERVTGGTREGTQNAAPGYRVPVGIRNLVKQDPEPRSRKTRKRGDGSRGRGLGAPKEGPDDQLVRNALELIADTLRQQQDHALGRSKAMFSFEPRTTDIPKSLNGDSLLELLRLEASNLSGPPSKPTTHPMQNQLPSTTPPTKKQRKKGKGEKSNKNGVIEDPRDLAGLSPPSTFKLPEEFTRIASGGINSASVRSLTDIFATCHPPSPKVGGGDGADGGGDRADPSGARATPTGSLLNSKNAELPPGFSLKTCDMSMFSLLDGMSNSNWINKLGETGGTGEQEPVEAVGNRPFAKLFGDQ